MLPTSSFRCAEMTAESIPRLQRFFEDNPEYHFMVEGRPPRPGNAREVFESLPPPGWSFERKWLLEFSGAGGEMIAMADVISNLFVDGVWHIGLFVLATPLQGRGVGRAIYNDLENWMREKGARWLRLGVVEGNVRAERFWETLGYVEVRRRLDVPMGERINDIRVMVKPLAMATIPEYLAWVERDRPETP